MRRPKRSKPTTKQLYYLSILLVAISANILFAEQIAEILTPPIKIAVLAGMIAGPVIHESTHLAVAYKAAANPKIKRSLWIIPTGVRFEVDELSDTEIALISGLNVFVALIGVFLLGLSYPWWTSGTRAFTGMTAFFMAMYSPSDWIGTFFPGEFRGDEDNGKNWPWQNAWLFANLVYSTLIDE